MPIGAGLLAEYPGTIMLVNLILKGRTSLILIVLLPSEILAIG
jgi:hypothetical protein